MPLNINYLCQLTNLTELRINGLCKIVFQTPLIFADLTNLKILVSLVNFYLKYKILPFYTLICIYYIFLHRSLLEVTHQYLMPYGIV